MGGITLAQAAAWCGGWVAAQHAQTTFFGANFDTRRLREGELFVAIVGQRDGHAFVTAAMERGAAAVLASSPLDASVPAIYVEDTVAALQDIARGYRKQLSCKVIGITGSVGKTTTKEMIASVLQTELRTVKTAENFNNGIGLPVTVLGIAPDCQVAVLEMGMNHFGEIALLTSIARPDIAVITNIGTMHIENLGSREGIRQAKLEILEGLVPGGSIIFNGEDDMLRTAGVDAIFFGFGDRCQVRAENVRLRSTGTEFTARVGECSFEVKLPVAGQHNLLNALAAIAVGIEMGIAPVHLQRALGAFVNTGMRQRIRKLGELVVIEDCYNAGPESMCAALGVLSAQECTGKRIAILGGMLELGSFAPQAHFEVGRAVAESADALYAYGTCSKEYVRGALEAGLSQAAAYPTHEALVQALRIRAGDVVLIKGSRGMHMERVLQLLEEQK